MQPPPYPNSPQTAQVNGSMQTKPDGDSLPLMPLYKAASHKELPARPQEQEMEIVPLNSTSALALAPAPTPSPNRPLPTYHADRPMSRLAPPNTRNLHDSLLIYPPSQSVQHQREKDSQDRSGDATPTESIPPQYYSPFSPPEKPYAHLSMQLPYGASPVHREVTPPFAEQPATALGTYRAYSPALGTQRPSNSPQLGPVELASPYNRRSQSILLVPGAFHSPTNGSERTLSPPPLAITRKQQTRTLSPSPQFDSRRQQARSFSPSPQFESRQRPMGNLSPSPQYDDRTHQRTWPSRSMWHYPCVLLPKTGVKSLIIFFFSPKKCYIGNIGKGNSFESIIKREGRGLQYTDINST